jgi:hypothetical protein
VSCEEARKLRIKPSNSARPAVVSDEIRNRRRHVTTSSGQGSPLIAPEWLQR